MSSTNGSKAQPSREQVIREATYHAAVFGYYDTSEAAQQANLLTITLIDMAALEALPAGATHRLYVCINATAYFVTRYPGRYEVEPHNQIENQRVERELREAVLETALRHFTGEGTDTYHPGGGSQEKDRIIEALLEEGEDEQLEEGDQVRHPVIRDELPDIFLAGTSDAAFVAERQWSVAIGDFYCEVGLMGAKDDGSPNLVVLDGESEEPAR